MSDEPKLEGDELIAHLRNLLGIERKAIDQLEKNNEILKALFKQLVPFALKGMTPIQQAQFSRAVDDAYMGVH